MISIASTYRERAPFASDYLISGGPIVNWNVRDKHMVPSGAEELSGDTTIIDKDLT